MVFESEQIGYDIAMATLMLDDVVYNRLRAQAEANGHTPEEEVRQMINQRSRQRRADWAAEVSRIRTELHERYGDFPDAVSLIRAVRDEE